MLRAYDIRFALMDEPVFLHIAPIIHARVNIEKYAVPYAVTIAGGLKFHSASVVKPSRIMGAGQCDASRQVRIELARHSQPARLTPYI